MRKLTQVAVVVKALLITSVLLLNVKNVFAAGQPAVTVTEGAAGNKVVNAKILIDAPPSVVWQTITNYNELKNYLPGYKESKVLQASGSTKTIQLGVKVNPFLPTFRYQMKALENRTNYQVNLVRVAGDFEDIKASYKLLPADNGAQTLLVYNLNITLGSRVPDFGVNKTLQTSAESSMVAIRSQCNANSKIYLANAKK